MSSVKPTSVGGLQGIYGSQNVKQKKSMNSTMQSSSDKVMKQANRARAEQHVMNVAATYG